MTGLNDESKNRRSAPVPSQATAVTHEDLTNMFRLSVLVSFNISVAVGLVVYALIEDDAVLWGSWSLYAVLSVVARWIKSKHSRLGPFLSVVGAGAAITGGVVTGGLAPIILGTVGGGIALGNAIMMGKDSKDQLDSLVDEAIQKRRSLHLILAMSRLKWRHEDTIGTSLIEPNQTTHGSIEVLDIRNSTRTVKFYITVPKALSDDIEVVVEYTNDKWANDQLRHEHNVLLLNDGLSKHSVRLLTSARKLLFLASSGLGNFPSLLGRLKDLDLQYTHSEEFRYEWRNVTDISSQFSMLLDRKHADPFCQLAEEIDEFYSTRLLALEEQARQTKSKRPRYPAKAEDAFKRLALEIEILTSCPKLSIPEDYEGRLSEIQELQTRFSYLVRSNP